MNAQVCAACICSQSELWTFLLHCTYKEEEEEKERETMRQKRETNERDIAPNDVAACLRDSSCSAAVALRFDAFFAQRLRRAAVAAHMTPTAVCVFICRLGVVFHAFGTADSRRTLRSHHARELVRLLAVRLEQVHARLAVHWLEQSVVLHVFCYFCTQFISQIITVGCIGFDIAHGARAKRPLKESRGQWMLPAGARQARGNTYGICLIHMPNTYA